MLDHLVGKPSANWKRTQVLLTLFLGMWVLFKGNTTHLPRIIKSINRRAAANSPWKIALGSWMMYYLVQNLFLLVGLNAPEPLARLYKRSFYRATWILTALDAGFFTAMPIRPAFLRHICSVLFSFYYLLFADEAEERVRRVRATMSVDQIRLSWEKATQNPILRILSGILRPRMTIHKILFVDRPNQLPSTEMHFFYARPLETLKDQTSVLLQFPGGGFVSMPPPCHHDALTAWAKQTGMPVISVNYKKAPEYPYPWPVEECFDFYISLVRQRGKFLGLSGQHDLKIVIVGDSAGGNLASAVTLKVLDHNKAHPEDLLPVPAGLVLIYPALDFEMTCWMTPSQLSLIRSESTTKLIRSKSLMSLLESKDHLSHISPLSVVPDVEKRSNVWRRKFGLTPKDHDIRNEDDKKQRIRDRVQELSHVKTAWETSRIAMTSRMSFFNDRILTTDMMRAMAILYIGPHAATDFQSDYYLSPIVAPFDLLAQFPRTYMICGEKDPFVDDTVIFGGRIRQAKQQRRRAEGLEDDDDDAVLGDRSVRVKLLEGFSHAFLQMMAFLPEAHQAVRTISDWVLEIAEDGPCQEDSESDNGTPVTESPSSSIQMPTATVNNIANLTTHLDHIVTTEVDMINRRKSHLVSELLVKKVTR